MKRKEVYSRFFSGLPNAPIDEWNLEECRRVKSLLRPIFKNFPWFRGEVFGMLDKRIKEIYDNAS
jgi:hypothetical protein